MERFGRFCGFTRSMTEQDLEEQSEHKAISCDMPVRHVVMLKFKEDATDEAKAVIIEQLHKLPASIPEIKAIKCGVDAGLADGNHDVSTHKNHRTQLYAVSLVCTALSISLSPPWTLRMLKATKLMRRYAAVLKGDPLSLLTRVFLVRMQHAAHQEVIAKYIKPILALRSAVQFEMAAL